MMSTRPELGAVDVVMASLRSANDPDGVSLLCADVDEGQRTVVTDDQAAIAQFRSVQAAVSRTGIELPAGAITASMIASLAEASRIRPRLERWTPTDFPEGEQVELPGPREHIECSVSDALIRRKSNRRFGSLEAVDLSTLLYHSARVHSTWIAEDGFPASSRPAPSAGARHPIDMVIVPRAVTGVRLEAQSYVFDPIICRLRPVLPPMSNLFGACVQQTTEFLGSPPAVVIVLAGCISRTLSRYRGGLSLVYRDVGALIGTVGIVAAALDLACCAVAKAVPQEVTNNLLTYGWVDLGGIAIGGRV